LGIGIEYFRSPKFLQADGGWKRTVWMPKELKERVKDGIPEDLYDKIATEEDATDVESLKNFLKEKNHPVVTGVVRDVDGTQITKGWAEEVEEVPAAPEEVPPAPAAAPVSISGTMPQLPIPSVAPGAGGGIKLILKNANVTIEKIIIKKKE
ncbi:MAG: CO dehydrogenase/CO-methylating acetyl-CoA synthase complex subunit beta, partial [Candidatus Syntropharchaeia archaeon]